MAQPPSLYEFGPFCVDTRERLLWRNTEVVPLTPKVFDILMVLIQNCGHIMSKDEMIRLVWPDSAVEESNLSRNISTLRKALGDGPGEHRYIETIPWRGYRFVAGVREACDESTVNDSLAVLPFLNESAGPAAEYLADGITDSLIRKLSLIDNLKVMSRNSVFRYKVNGPNASLPNAEREFHQALELTPNYAQAHHWYAVYLANMGKHEEAIREAERARELDPLSLLMNMTA